MALQRGYNPQRTQNGAQLTKVSRGVEATPRQILMGKKTATNPQVTKRTMSAQMLNAIKASPKGVIPPSVLRGYASGPMGTKKLRVK